VAYFLGHPVDDSMESYSQRAVRLQGRPKAPPATQIASQKSAVDKINGGNKIYLVNKWVDVHF